MHEMIVLIIKMSKKKHLLLSKYSMRYFIIQKGFSIKTNLFGTNHQACLAKKFVNIKDDSKRRAFCKDN